MKALVQNIPCTKSARLMGHARGTRWLAGFTLAWIGLVAGTGCQRAEPTPPNVLVYVVDTLRADAVDLQNPLSSSTPHFAALAQEGVSFENAYANASWTRASVASLLTGLLPWHHAAESRADRLPGMARTLSEYFAERGYSTAIISANPNVSEVFGFQQGVGSFRELYARSGPGLVGGHELVTPSDVVTNETIRWLQGTKPPFFILALAIDPHAPYQPPAEFDPGQHRKEDPIADAARIRSNEARVRERYAGEVAFNDASFGQLVAFLKSKNLWDETVVVVTSDHGEAFWEYGRAGHGQSLSEEVLRVPLILRGLDDRLPSGQRSTQPVSLIDLAPTLLDLAHIRRPDGLDGQSLLEDSETSRPILAGLDLDQHRLLSAGDPPYKLVRYLKTGKQTLYHLSGPGAESIPIDPDRDPAALEAQARLQAALAQSLTQEERTLTKSRAGRIPGQVEESLRALGYIE